MCAKTDDGKLNFDDITALSNAVEFSRRENLVKKEAALERLKLALHILEDDTELKKRSIDGFFRSVTNTINELKTFLTTGKDSIVYTFESSVKSQLSRLYGAKKHNSAEIKKYGKAKKKYYNRIEFGMTVNYTVQEPSLIDLSEVRKNLTLIVTRLGESLKADIANESGVDYTEKATDIIGLLKELEEASGNIVTKSIAKERAIKIMGEVGIPSPEIRYNQYPFEFSGGMRQRIVIATALVANPKLLICDEPTTALDVTIQAQILELINELKATRNISVIFITHDLGVVAQMADRVAVMYAGKIVESGTAEDIFYEPRHPYTWALLSSMPDTDTKGDLEAIPGTPPNMIYPPKGDAFAPRNKYALAIDFEQMPPLISVSDTHSVASWLVHPDAPKVDPPLVVSERIARMMALQNPDNANINDGNGGENE
ncbi:MAG: ATP-binding cassette domain-containing protein [Christensenellaceae bacterium]|nr:ATP-binding cassette domain-containing protein [Christensenellaceae bacterium]